jgi:hypothetical protein
MELTVLFLCEAFAEPPAAPGNMSARKAPGAGELFEGPAAAPLVLGTETVDLDGPAAAPCAFIGCERLVDTLSMSFPLTLRLSLDFFRSLVSISIGKRNNMSAWVKSQRGRWDLGKAYHRHQRQDPSHCQF